MQNPDRKLLIFSYYFPPLGMGGVQRTAKFVKYLPDFHWHPEIVTVKDIQYYAYDHSLEDDMRGCAVHRTGSADPNRLLYLATGKRNVSSHTAGSSVMLPLFSRILWIPDAKRGWLPFAVRKGHFLLKKGRFSAILTSSPPLSAHKAGLTLSRRHGLPWVADFRDHWRIGPQTQPASRNTDRSRLGFTRKIVNAASAIVSVSPPITEDLCALRRRNDDACMTIPNGFDPDDFSGIPEPNTKKFVITYSGTLSTMLNPEPFFRALRLALDREPVLAQALQVNMIGRATDIASGSLCDRYSLTDIVNLRGYMPHRQAVTALLASHLLLFLLPDTCTRGMVTGKLYEYLAAGRPILAFAGQCEAREILSRHPECTLVRNNQFEEAAQTIIRMFGQWRKDGDRVGRKKLFPDIDRFNRRNQTRALAELLNSLQEGGRQ